MFNFQLIATKLSQSALYTSHIARLTTSSSRCRFHTSLSSINVTSRIQNHRFYRGFSTQPSPQLQKSPTNMTYHEARKILSEQGVSGYQDEAKFLASTPLARRGGNRIITSLDNIPEDNESITKMYQQVPVRAERQLAVREVKERLATHQENHQKNLSDLFKTLALFALFSSAYYFIEYSYDDVDSAKKRMVKHYLHPQFYSAVLASTELHQPLTEKLPNLFAEIIPEYHEAVHRAKFLAAEHQKYSHPLIPIPHAELVIIHGAGQPMALGSSCARQFPTATFYDQFDPVCTKSDGTIVPGRQDLDYDARLDPNHHVKVDMKYASQLVSIYYDLMTLQMDTLSTTIAESFLRSIQIPDTNDNISDKTKPNPLNALTLGQTKEIILKRFMDMRDKARQHTISYISYESNYEFAKYSHCDPEQLPKTISLRGIQKVLATVHGNFFVLLKDAYLAGIHEWLDDQIHISGPSTFEQAQLDDKGEPYMVSIPNPLYKTEQDFPLTNPHIFEQTDPQEYNVHLKSAHLTSDENHAYFTTAAECQRNIDLNDPRTASFAALITQLYLEKLHKAREKKQQHH